MVTSRPLNYFVSCLSLTARIARSPHSNVPKWNLINVTNLTTMITKHIFLELHLYSRVFYSRSLYYWSISTTITTSQISNFERNIHTHTYPRTLLTTIILIVFSAYKKLSVTSLKNTCIFTIPDYYFKSVSFL